MELPVLLTKLPANNYNEIKLHISALRANHSMKVNNRTKILICDDNNVANIWKRYRSIFCRIETIDW